MVVLQVQKSQSFLTLKQRHVGKVPFIEVKTLRVGVALTGLTVNDEDSRDLRELCENNSIFIFNSSYDSILQ